MTRHFSKGSQKFKKIFPYTFNILNPSMYAGPGNGTVPQVSPGGVGGR
jgi:hypothetical protein